MKSPIYLNAKNQAKKDAHIKAHKILDRIAFENGFKAETRLKAGSNSSYSYSDKNGSSVYGFDSPEEARDYFLRTNWLMPDH